MDQAKRLKELEKENGKLKRLAAELSLEKKILKDMAEGAIAGVASTASPSGSAQTSFPMFTLVTFSTGSWAATREASG